MPPRKTAIAHTHWPPRPQWLACTCRKLVAAFVARAFPLSLCLRRFVAHPIHVCACVCLWCVLTLSPQPHPLLSTTTTTTATTRAGLTPRDAAMFKLAPSFGKKKKREGQALALQGEYNFDPSTQPSQQPKPASDDVSVVVSPLRSPDRRKPLFRAASSKMASPYFQRRPSGAGSPAANDANLAVQHSASGGLFEDIVLSTRDPRNPPAQDMMDIQVQAMQSTREQALAAEAAAAQSGALSNANLQAMALIGFSAFIYSLQTLNVKLLGAWHFDSWTSTLFRGIVGTLLCLVHSLFFKAADHRILGSPENRRMLCLRGFLGGLTIASAFYAVNALDLSEASVIIFTAPLWTAILSRACGMGAWERIDTFSALTCLVGMVLVTQPPLLYDGVHDKGDNGGATALGIFASLLSAVTAAGVNVTISQLKREDASTITLYAMLGSVLVALPGFAYHQVGPKGKHMLWHARGEVLAQLCLTGILSWVAQMCKTSGLKRAKSQGVLVMRYLDIVFCFVWDVSFLHAVLDVPSMVGATIIVGGCVVSVLKKKNSS